jgi:D-specific alpha-keto acid dehydrogenase
MPCRERTRRPTPTVVPTTPPPPPTDPPRTPRTVGLTVYGCDPDEAAAFDALAPRFGVRPTLLVASACEHPAIPVPGNRCVSVDHRSEVGASTLRVLRAAGVDHVSTRSIGVDHIDLDAAAALGVTVQNVVYPADGVADFTLMLILMALRDAKATVVAAGRRDFRLAHRRGRELRGTTVGVVGVGHIGTAVIERLRGFGCRVLAHGTSQDRASSMDLVPLDELLASSDVVTLHVPLTADTFHLIGREELARMRPGVVLVNTARGAVVDTEALVDALEDGHLGGAGLDVVEGEERAFYRDCSDRPDDGDALGRLGRLPNVVLTPHTAYYTDRALHRAVETTLARCVAFERSRTNG